MKEIAVYILSLLSIGKLPLWSFRYLTKSLSVSSLNIRQIDLLAGGTVWYRSPFTGVAIELSRKNQFRLWTSDSILKEEGRRPISLRITYETAPFGTSSRVIELPLTTLKRVNFLLYIECLRKILYYLKGSSKGKSGFSKLLNFVRLKDDRVIFQIPNDWKKIQLHKDGRVDFKIGKGSNCIFSLHSLDISSNEKTLNVKVPQEMQSDFTFWQQTIKEEARYWYEIIRTKKLAASPSSFHVK